MRLRRHTPSARVGGQVAPVEPEPPGGSPVLHARRELARALSAAHSTARVDVALASAPGTAELLAGAGVTLDPRAES